MKEIWKDIPGYEGYYQVSNLGRVKSLDRFCSVRSVSRKGHKLHDEMWKRKSKILKPQNCGLPVVRLYRDDRNSKVRKQVSVKYLVAQAFVSEFTSKTRTRDIKVMDPSKPLSSDNLEIENRYSN